MFWAKMRFRCGIFQLQWYIALQQTRQQAGSSVCRPHLANAGWNSYHLPQLATYLNLGSCLPHPSEFVAYYHYPLDSDAGRTQWFLR
jgi:hypothetical protein